jgi:hypothetical protein
MNANKELLTALHQYITACQDGELPEVKKIDGKYSVKSAIYTRFNGHMKYVVALDNGMYLTADTLFELEIRVKNRNKQVEELTGRQNADNEFRMEVVEAMEAEGIARHVALNRTASHQKLMECAKEFGII